MIVVVSDTSPVRALAHLNHLDLLHRLFDSILVPPAVEHELRLPPSRLVPVDVSQIPFMVVQKPRDRDQVHQFLKALDPGESEALALALETEASAILMDERAGRSVASHHGIPVVGTLGILLRAKNRGMIPALRPLVDRLIAELGFFISAVLFEEILRRANE